MSFLAIYSHIATVTGWTFDHIRDEMTLPEVRALTQYWSEHPPTHIILAAVHGVGRKKQDQKKALEQAMQGAKKFVPPVPIKG